MPWTEKEGRTVDEARAAAIAAAGRPEDELDIEVLREGAKGLFGLGGEPALVRVRPRDEARDVRAAFQDDLGPSSSTTREQAAPEAVPEPAPPALEPAPLAPEPAPEPAADEPTMADEREPAEDVPAEEEAEDAVPVAERQQAAADVGIEMLKGILERMGIEGEVTSRVQGGTVYVEVFGDDMGILIGRGGATLEALQELVRAGVRRRVRARQAVVVDVEAYWDRRRSGRRRPDDQAERD